MRKALSAFALVLMVAGFTSQAQAFTECTLDYKGKMSNVLVGSKLRATGTITCYDDWSGESDTKDVKISNVGLGLFNIGRCNVEGHVKMEGVGIKWKHILKVMASVKVPSLNNFGKKEGSYYAGGLSFTPIKGIQLTAGKMVHGRSCRQLVNFSLGKIRPL